MWNGASLTLHFSIISRPICKFLICRFHGIRQRLTDQIQSFLHQKNETQNTFCGTNTRKCRLLIPPFFIFFLAQEHRNALAKYFWLACDFPPEPFYLDLRLLNFRRADLNYNFEL